MWLKTSEVENVEMKLLLEAIHDCYGYDFRNYARASLKRRVRHAMGMFGVERISELLPLILYDVDAMNKFFKSMSVSVTEMFRDPAFFLAIRQHVIPVLRTYPYVKIWHAGCATGEEVYSMAIVLKEEGFYDRAQIYATDYNEYSLDVAREGIYPAQPLQLYTKNYYKAGGTATLSDYYYAKYESAKMDESLRKQIVFANHNLATDAVFGEMNLVVCRNVLIYFDRTLQGRVLRLFDDSLVHGGFLGLGAKETLELSDIRSQYRQIRESGKLFHKVGIGTTADSMLEVAH